MVSRPRKKEPSITWVPTATRVKPIAVAYSWESGPKPSIAQATKIVGERHEAGEEQEPADCEPVLERDPPLGAIDQWVGLARCEAAKARAKMPS